MRIVSTTLYADDEWDALVLIGFSVSQWVFVIAINQLLLAMYTFRRFELTYEFNFTCLLAGIAMLVAEGVFKTGLSLEEDRQLTI